MDTSDQSPGNELIELARAQFVEAISEYSEDRWCAGWMRGIENDVREIGGRFLLMAFTAGGWPLGYRGEDGWDPLTPEELEAVTTMTETPDDQTSVARSLFIEAISTFSEARWCAGWMHGIERDVREIGGRFLLMAFTAGGWPIGYRGEDGWDPLTPEELASLPAHITDPKGQTDDDPR